MPEKTNCDAESKSWWQELRDLGVLSPVSRFRIPRKKSLKDFFGPGTLRIYTGNPPESPNDPVPGPKDDLEGDAFWSDLFIDKKTYRKHLIRYWECEGEPNTCRICGDGFKPMEWYFPGGKLSGDRCPECGRKL
jgi:hypothetical protein